MESESSVQVQVTLELGHTASCRKKPTVEGFTHDWKVFVRGPDNCDVSHFVEKVQFQLHESFAKPKRVVKEPPYHIEQSGYGGFVLPIDIYFKNKEDPKKVHFDYDLFLPAVGLAPINNIRSEALTFTNPTEEFKKKLLKGGGTIIHTNVNGFHSTTVSQNRVGETTGKTMREVTEDQIAGPAEETEKAKKVKVEKTNGNKTNSRKQEHRTAGEKRPATSGNSVPTPPVKKKKKKVEEGGTVKSKPVGFIPLELPAQESEWKEKLEEVSDVKLKIKSLPQKMNNERKKEAKTSSTSVSNTKKCKSSTSGKKSKEKPKDTKSTGKQVKEDKQIQKIKVRRGSNDSSTSSSSLIIGNIGSTSKNLALGTLLKEMEVDSEGDDDDDEHLDIVTPFQSNSVQPSGTTKESMNGVKSPSNSSSQRKVSKTVTKSSKTHSKSNGHVEDGPQNRVKPCVVKTSPSKQSPKAGLQESKAVCKNQLSVSELLQLHKRLMATRDATCLQRVVDILETTGAYSISDTTLDFDLCALDRHTVKKIESCLGR